MDTQPQPTQSPPHAANGAALDWIMGPLGAIAGGVIGFFAFDWIVKQGFYAMALPGALIGLGCGTFIRRRNILLGILCGLGALIFSLYLEFSSFHPLMTFPDFLKKFATFERYNIEKLMIAIGTVLAASFGVGRNQK